MTEHDTKIGAALRQLEVPDHDPAFFAELQARLTEEEPRRARAVGAPRRRPVLRVVAAGVLALALVAIALVRDGGGPAPRLGTPAATAAEVRATALRSWAALRSLSGRAVVRARIAPDEPVVRQSFDFAITSRGDLRTSERDGAHAVYDASAGTEVILGDPNYGGPVVRRGLAAAAPDAHASEELLQRSLAATVRAMRAGRGSSVREVRFARRPAWLLRIAVPVNKLGYSGDTLDVVVDRASGLALRARETYRGRLVRDLRLKDLQADQPVRITLPQVPAGATPLVTDDGFQRVAPDAVPGIVRYTPPAPGWVPEGFTRAETFAAVNAQPTGTEGMNPPSEGVVQAVWRRGLDRLVVTTRRAGDGAQPWADPLAAGEGYLATPERVRFRDGALAGTTGEVILDPRAVPHMWSRTRELVVTVSGDVSRAELLRVAGSLGA